MGGYYPTGKEAEHNFKFGGRKTAQAVNNWPAPILFGGWELGVKIVTGARGAEMPTDSPIRRAYDLYCKPGEGHFSWD